MLVTSRSARTLRSMAELVSAAVERRARVGARQRLGGRRRWPRAVLVRRLAGFDFDAEPQEAPEE